MIQRVVYLSMHTSPLLTPGEGNAGGMNVYINELAHTMADRGVDVTVFTRRTDDAAPDTVTVRPGYRVVHVSAGPAAPVPMSRMPEYVGSFAEGTLEHIKSELARPDVLHSHYWLSGWAGVLLKEVLDVPLANSFHTLGRVKDLTRRADEPPSSRMRTLTEQEVIQQSDCVIASTPYEFDDLLDHYGASPERLCTSPPGIDHDVFVPGDRTEARAWLGLDFDAPLVLFVGRIQPLKAADVAVEALAGLSPVDGTLPHLVLIGGPSGALGDDEMIHLHHLTKELDLDDRVHFIPTQPHEALTGFYQAADVLVVPSRSETFGLVAAEAQACGLPVVAASVGGLPYAIADGASGILVEGHDPADYAAALNRILQDPERAMEMSQAAVALSERFSWKATADRLLELYEGIQPA